MYSLYDVYNCTVLLAWVTQFHTQTANHCSAFLSEFDWLPVPLCSWPEPRVQTVCRWSTYLGYFHTQFKDLCLFIKYSTFPACVLWDTVIFNFNLLTSQNITTDHIYQVLTFCAFCYRDQGRHGTGGQTDGRKATLNVLDATLPPVERLVMFTPKQHIKHRAYIYKKLTRRWDSERELFTTTS